MCRHSYMCAADMYTCIACSSIHAYFHSHPESTYAYVLSMHACKNSCILHFACIHAYTRAYIHTCKCMHTSIACMHACTNTYIYIHTYCAYIHAHTHVHTYLHTNTYTIYIYIYIYINIYIYMYVCIYMRNMCVCVYIYIYIVHTYMHTRVHTYLHTNTDTLTQCSPCVSLFMLFLMCC
jgi:hypothetical protein